MLLFAPQHSLALGSAIAAQLDASLSASEEREFEGGEHKMRPLVDVQGRHACVIQSLYGDSGGSANDKLCRLLFFIGALKDAGAAEVTAVVPYLAYARKDRRTQPRDPVTTRYVAAMFEAMGVDRVIAVDVHNEAAFDNSFRCQTLRIEAAESFAAALAQTIGDRKAVVASPDVGGIKRAQRMRDALANRLGRDVGFAFVEKRRALGIVSGEALVGAVEEADVVFYDDMIVSGGTILRAAKAARQSGASRIHIAAAHAAFVPSAQALFQGTDIDTVHVSDSVPLATAFAPFVGAKLVLCSVAPLLATAISALSHGAPRIAQG